MVSFPSCLAGFEGSIPTCACFHSENFSCDLFYYIVTICSAAVQQYIQSNLCLSLPNLSWFIWAVIPRRYTVCMNTPTVSLLLISHSYTATVFPTSQLVCLKVSIHQIFVASYPVYIVVSIQDSLSSKPARSLFGSKCVDYHFTLLNCVLYTIKLCALTHHLQEMHDTMKTLTYQDLGNMV